jgi:hypothetical protein
MPWPYLQASPATFLSFQVWAASAGLRFEVFVNSGLPHINTAAPPRSYDTASPQGLL